MAPTLRTYVPKTFPSVGDDSATRLYLTNELKLISDSIGSLVQNVTPIQAAVNSGNLAHFDQLEVNRCVDVSGTDLNNLLTGGFYNGSNLTNSPDGTTNWFYVETVVHSATPTYCMQRATHLTANPPTMYWRTRIASSWNAWQQVEPVPGAWTPFTSAVSSTVGSGVVGTCSGRYSKVGKTVNINVTIACTSIGSGTGYLTWTPPVAGYPTEVQMLSGREYQSNGSVVWCLIEGGGSYIGYYNNTTTVVASTTFGINGVYESA